MKELNHKPGYEWVSSANGSGYWSKIKNKNGNSNRLPIFCPVENCRRITGTIDDKYLEEYGICSVCYVLHVESRKIPTIDLEKYKPARAI